MMVFCILFLLVFPIQCSFLMFLVIYSLDTPVLLNVSARYFFSLFKFLFYFLHNQPGKNNARSTLWSALTALSEEHIMTFKNLWTFHSYVKPFWSYVMLLSNYVMWFYNCIMWFWSYVMWFWNYVLWFWNYVKWF